MNDLLKVPFSIDVEDARIVPDEFAPGQVLRGEPRMGTALLWQSPDGKILRGVWEVTPGSFGWDFEADELFVVLRGRAEIEVAGGASVHVGPGSMAVFQPGDRTTWHVHETIRKVFHITGD